MLDCATQQKFVRGCTQAAAGYAAAATAAYTDLASQALDFWSTALSGLGEAPAPAHDGEVIEVTKTEWHPEPPFGMALSDWCAFHWLDPRRFETMLQLNSTTPPFAAMMAFANVMPLRGSSASWPFAQVMIESGVPRAVAWPTAEANAAVLEAADLASRDMRQVLANYHTENGFAGAVRSATPSLGGIMTAMSMSLSPGLLTAWA